MRRWLYSMLLALPLLLLCLPAAAQEAPFQASLAAARSQPGDSTDLVLAYDGSLGEVGAFVVFVDFPSPAFTYERVRKSAAVQQGYTTALCLGEGKVGAAYTRKAGSQGLASTPETFTFRFQVAEGAPAGEFPFTVRIVQALSADGGALCPDQEIRLFFTVEGLPSSDAGLQGLTPSVGGLDQPFSPRQFFYTMAVPSSVNSLTFQALPAPGATCRVNRKSLEAAGSETEFIITVTAADGKTKQTYHVTVYREEKSHDATLAGLQPDTGQLEPSFSPGRFQYTMTVPPDVSSVGFAMEPAPGATCHVNRKSLEAAGSETEFIITVTAADGKTKQTYHVTVYREEKSHDATLAGLQPDTGQLEPSFSPGRFQYTMTVPPDISSVGFAMEPAPGATCRVNRKSLEAAGSETEFIITVTAADGKTKQTYHVTVYREEKSHDATLAGLQPDTGQLEPSFSPDRFQYTMTVPPDVSSMGFAMEPAPGATCRVNRKNLEAAGSETEFIITVTAADGKTKQTYQVTVYREEQSHDATLAGLQPDTGQLEPSFSPGRFQYTMTVPPDVSSVGFAMEPASGATCRVNRKSLEAAGSETEFIITVTAADGKTKQTYQVTVYREEKSHDATLAGLQPDTGQLEPSFSPGRFQYTMTVPPDVSSVGFAMEPAPGATCRVNRKNLEAAGSETEFIITVTAADGKTKQTYQVTVYREEGQPLSGDAALVSLKPETGQLEPPFSPGCLQYTMAVPFSVKSMAFQAEPAEGASCRVNRKNLGAGGSDTEFRITVTAADGKTKQEYQVVVHREENVAASSQAAGGPASTPSSKPANSATAKPTPSPAGKGPAPKAAETAAPAESAPVDEPLPENGITTTPAPTSPPPTIVVQNGTGSPVYVLAFCFFMLVLYVSKPLAGWLCKAGRRKGGPPT